VPRVFVTGIGVIAAIGVDPREVYESLENSRTGIGNLTGIDSVYRNEIPVGEIRISNKELTEMARPLCRGFFSRTALLGVIAARQAVHQAGISGNQLENAALISGTTVGGMDQSEIFYQQYLRNRSSGKISLVSSHDCGDSTEKIADCLGVRGFLSTINTACSSSANAIMLGARMIKQGRTQRVIAGGSDSLTKFTINGFNSLMILDRNQCKPFDENRNGLNLGEGSAFIVLESADAVKPDAVILGEVTGYGNACDAFHQTASSPDGHGAYLSMQLALKESGLTADKISYINTHGTGTKNNDLSEGIAIERLFGSSIPPCSSTKSYTGHTLGAAGAIEAVISLLAIQHQCIFPNLNFADKMQELGFSPVNSFMPHVPLHHVMSNSFGFGGNNSSLIFSKHTDGGLY
jgi:3-oxoacyl-(acyl-carrier-protein) synthase